MLTGGVGEIDVSWDAVNPAVGRFRVTHVRVFGGIGVLSASWEAVGSVIPPPPITPPNTQLSTPTGLALTESSGDITAAWNVVTDATSYVLEWREEGSGDAWQTVAVTSPPHTFTP